MNKKLVWLFTLLFLAPGTFADAQQPAKVPKIGWLGIGGGGPGPELFRRELRELGYVEGKNIAFEYRYAGGKLDRVPALADELVRLKADVFVTSSSAPEDWTDTR